VAGDVADSNWKSLYRIGGVAPLIALAFYLTQMLVIAFGEAYPATIEDWFSLFQRSKVLGLLYLNALDVFSIAFLGTMFLALYSVRLSRSVVSRQVAREEGSASRSGTNGLEPDNRKDGHGSGRTDCPLQCHVGSARLGGGLGRCTSGAWCL
jgi:hypothetical protein